jgi:hypothetical protein
MAAVVATSLLYDSVTGHFTKSGLQFLRSYLEDTRYSSATEILELEKKTGCSMKKLRVCECYLCVIEHWFVIFRLNLIKCDGMIS